MSNIKISEMTEATSLNDNDLLTIVQDGMNKKISKQNAIGDIIGAINNPTYTTTEGTDLTITNSRAGNMKFEFYGNTEQITTTGENLLPISSLTSTTQAGITFTNNNDGSYTFNGTASSYVGLTLFSNMDFSGNNTYVLKEMATTGLTAYLQTGTETVTCTTYSTTDKNIKNIVIGIQSGTSLNNLIIKPYVYSGNYDSSIVYEPYSRRNNLT